MKALPTALAGILILEPTVFADERGSFMETWNERTIGGLGVDAHFVQDNVSRSVHGVVRGLHYQIKQPQGKLVRCVTGAIYDVVVDLRRDSPDFGKWHGVELSADNRRMLWVPIGFAHGFMVTAATAEVSYKVTDFWSPPDERTIRWDDPDLAITWPACDRPIVSARDATGVRFRDAETV